MQDRVLPPHACLDLKEAGYPQGDSRYVWIMEGDQWDLVERHEAPSADNRISAMTSGEADKWKQEAEYLTPDECEEIRSEGYPQGKSKYLWHKDKHQHDRWVLYKRNQYDMSSDADKCGFNRWVTAVEHCEAKCFREKQKPVPLIEREVSSLTFSHKMIDDPRKSACIFATSIRDDLISITETILTSRPAGYDIHMLEVTVYHWKEA